MDRAYKTVDLEVEVVWSGRAVHKVSVAVPEDWDLEMAARHAEKYADEFEVHMDDTNLQSSFRVRPIGDSASSHTDMQLDETGVSAHDPWPLFVEDPPTEDRWFSWRERRWSTNGIALVRADAPRPIGFWVNGDPSSVWMGRHPEILEATVKTIDGAQPLRWIGTRSPGRSVLQGDDGSIVLVDSRLSFLVRACVLVSLGPCCPIECRLVGEVVAYVMPCRDD